MRGAIKSYTLRLDAELLRKFRYIAGYNCRSINQQIVNLMIFYVNEYERRNGPIEFEAEDKTQ